jgi:hypothetical protein
VTCIPENRKKIRKTIQRGVISSSDLAEPEKRTRIGIDRMISTSDLNQQSKKTENRK